MPDVDTVVIGAGAAGVAAARRLVAAGRSVVVLEARQRVGGRGWTNGLGDLPLDLGCGWLHSAGGNEWTALAERHGFAVDATPAPWQRETFAGNFPIEDQRAYRAAMQQFYERVDALADAPDRPASALLEPGNRWNALLDSISTYANGVELDGLSVVDYCRYVDTGENRRVVAGYGALIAAHGAGLDVRLGCPADVVDHSGRELRIGTPQGTLTAAQAIVTVPTPLIAGETPRFVPALPDKIAAARQLPLGVADKIFLHVADADELAAETRLLGATDHMTASYHLRPFGRPVIEGFVGGALARELEADGALAAFAIDELVGVFGSAFRPRLTVLAASAWARDPFAQGSYSHARVGGSEARAVLAAPVDGRLYFAGEACSRHDYSTAHGAYRTGVAAAERILAATNK